MQKDITGKFVPGKTRIKYGGAYTDKKDFKMIQSVLDRNWWTIDEHGKKFEDEVARYIGHKHTIVLNSGSSALLVAFAALGFEEGSEIITGAVHFPTAITALYYNRLVPVYIDVEPQTLGINPELIEQVITPKTRAILAVAIAGSIPNIDAILKIAKQHNLKVILDNCDGFGGAWGGKPIDSYFDVACTSFHAAHILNMGEGGAIMTSDNLTGRVARSMREWGRIGDTDKVSNYPDIPSDYPGRYIFQYMGFNLKPLELQCAMGRSQLIKVDMIKELRRRNYEILFNGLVASVSEITLMNQYPQADPSWFSFPMFAKNRGELRKFLEDRQIETRTIFGGNITRQPAFSAFGRKATELPVADRVMTEGMFVSVHPGCTEEMMEYIVKSIKEFYGRN